MIYAFKVKVNMNSISVIVLFNYYNYFEMIADMSESVGKYYAKCIENLYNKSFECLANPYINEEFILMNASQTQYRICGNNSTEYSVNKNYCKDKCVKNCHQKYYSLELEDNTYSAQKDSKIRIEYKLSQEFHYKSGAKYSFVDFMSNIGGLIGLWFGMSFIDTSALIRLVLNHIKLFILFYIHFEFLIILQNLKLIIILKIEKLSKYKWRQIITLITLPIICFQISMLCDNYLQYSTQTSIQLIKYKNNNRIPLQSIPAITLCYENTFQDILQSIQPTGHYYEGSCHQLNAQIYFIVKTDKI